MTNTMIYLATITQPKDYSADYILDTKAFSTLEKAKAFMEESGMTENSWGDWEKENSAIFGDIMTLRVD